jgi:hypothetical protein
MKKWFVAAALVIFGIPGGIRRYYTEQGNAEAHDDGSGTERGRQRYEGLQGGA